MKGMKVWVQPYWSLLGSIDAASDEDQSCSCACEILMKTSPHGSNIPTLQ